MEKKLEIIVAGKLVGTVKLKLNGNTTIVDGGGIMSTGEYSMKPKEIEEMIYRRVARDNIKISINKNF